MSDIAVIGAGYVGIPTAACFAHLGHHVVCADVDEDRVRAASQGRGADPRGGASRPRRRGPARRAGCASSSARPRPRARRRVRLPLRADAAVRRPAPPTSRSSRGGRPRDRAGAAARARSWSTSRRCRSAPPTSVARVLADGGRRRRRRRRVEPRVPARGAGGRATTLAPHRVVIGCDDTEVAVRVSELYRDVQAPILVTDPASAEMIKYASNAFLATKISFVNAIANLCEAVNADVREVVLGMGYDPRIGFEVLHPGPGLRRLVLPEGHRRAAAHRRRGRLRLRLLRGVIEVNDAQRDRVVDKLRAAAGGEPRRAPRSASGASPSRRTPTTSATRRRCTIVERLVDEGATVRAYDPAAGDVPRVGARPRASSADAVRRLRRARRSLACSPSGTSSAGSTSTGCRAMEPPSRSSTPGTCSTRRRCAAAASRTRGSAADAPRRRHRRRRVPRFAPVRGAARAGWDVVAVDNLSTGCIAERRRICSAEPDFELVEHDVVHGLPVDGPVDAVLHFASPASPPVYLAHPIETLEVGVDRHAARARAGAQARGRAVPPRVDQRGLRRPARAPAARGLLGQREPGRSPVGLRRGEALRRGDHDGVPPHVRARHQDRPHLQHLRPATEAGRRAGRLELPRAGDARRAAHRLRRRLRRPGRSATSTTRSRASSPCSSPTISGR